MSNEYEDQANDEEPCYVISVAARMVGMHAQSLRYYERMGVLKPSRSEGRIRLYSVADVNRLRQIHRLIERPGREPGRRGSDIAHEPAHPGDERRARNDASGATAPA